MMQDKLPLFSTLTLVITALISPLFASEYELPKSVIEIMPLIEKHNNLDSSDIHSQIPFTFFKRTLEHYCPAQTINTAKEKLKKLIPERESCTIGQRSPNQLTIDFLNLKQFYLDINNTNETVFCEQKYLSLTILESTKNYFLKLDQKIDQKQQIPDSKTMKTHASEYRSKPTEPEHHAAPAPQLQLIHYTNQLKNSQLKVKMQTEQLIYSILQDMQSKNILLAKDMKNLDGKIEIHYLQACKASKGSFHLLTDPQRRNHIFKAIKLQLHLCNKLPSTQQLWKHIQHLLAHELGHYISFFREKDASNFWKICRKGKANICNYKDFNSQYAQTNVDEDYAESFAYRYRYSQDRKSHPASGSEKLQQKEEYFDKLFSQSP